MWQKVQKLLVVNFKSTNYKYRKQLGSSKKNQRYPWYPHLLCHNADNIINSNIYTRRLYTLWLYL